MFTHAHVSTITYRVDVYRSRSIGTSLSKDALPGSDGPVHRGWLGVVTGIRLIHIIAAQQQQRRDKIRGLSSICHLRNSAYCTHALYSYSILDKKLSTDCGSNDPEVHTMYTQYTFSHILANFRHTIHSNTQVKNC